MLTFTRRWIVLFCLAVILIAALNPSASGQLLAILVPLWFIFSFIVAIPLRDIAGQRTALVFPFLPVLAPRPPPVV